MGIKIPTLYLILLIEFGLILLGLAAFLFLRRLKLKKRHSPAEPVETTVEKKPKEEIPKEEKAAPPGEKEELLKKIAALEKALAEKDKKIASLEKEYQVLYEQQAEAGKENK